MTRPRASTPPASSARSGGIAVGYKVSSERAVQFRKWATRVVGRGRERAGLLATCRRGDASYELSLADVVFPTASACASLDAQARRGHHAPARKVARVTQRSALATGVRAAGRGSR